MENLKVAEEKGTGALNEIDGEEAKPSTPKDALKTVDEEGAATPTGKENEPPLEAVARPLTRRETKRLVRTDSHELPADLPFSMSDAARHFRILW